MSEWRASSLVQRSLVEVVTPLGPGVLQQQPAQQSALHICMSSDDEEQPAPNHSTAKITLCIDLDTRYGEHSMPRSNSDVILCIDAEDE